MPLAQVKTRKRPGGKISNKKNTCKRRRVRISANGSYNKDDMEHNKKCEQKHMLGNNPWMKPLLNKKNTKGYDKYLKHLVKNRTKTVKNRKFKGGFEPEEVRRSLNDGGWADVIARNIVQQRIDGHLEDLAAKRDADREYISGSKANIQMKDRYRSLHRKGCSVELLKTKKSGSDAPDRKDDPDYLKVFVVGNNPTHYQGDSGEYFVKHNPFIEGDKLYIRDFFYNPNKQNPKDDGQLLGTITKLGQRFFPYTELQDVQKYNSRFYNVRKMEDGTYEADFHFSLRYDDTPEIVAEREKQTKAGGPGIYALEITYKNNGQPLVNPYKLARPERGDYRGMADSSNPACLYTKDTDRERKMLELTHYPAPVPDSGAAGKGFGPGAGPGVGPGVGAGVAAGGKKKSKGKKTRRPRRK